MTRPMGFVASAIVVGALLTVSACTETGVGVDGNGDIVTETRMVPAFDSVSVSNGVELDLVVDAATSGTVDLRASTDSNLIEYLITEVDETSLRATIDGPSGGTSSSDGYELSATVARLVSVSMNDGAVATFSGVAGDLDFAGDNGSVATIAGSGAALTLEADNGAVVSADLYSAEVVTIDVDNGAVVTICATGSVTGTAKNGAVVTVGCGGDVTGVTTSNGAVLDSG